MQQQRAREHHLLQSLLVLADRLSTQLDALLQFSLEKALSMTASDVGGTVLYFETSDREPLLLACALRGELAESSAALIKKWNSQPADPINLLIEKKVPRRVSDYRREASSPALFSGGRSSLWVPLLGGEQQAIGAIHVESSRPGYYTDSHAQQLQNLATQIVAAAGCVLLREDAAKSGMTLDFVGVSPVFLELEQQIKQAAAHPSAPVLITGERGSGKELASRAIHCWGTRRGKPFVPVLASALTESLFADELFGHAKHAFTGAAQSRSGKFQAAEGGILFLDEVGDMPPPMQAALLRVIERGEITRIGTDLPVRVDVRVVAATNKNLCALVERGEFRADLFDRLSVFQIRVPALRERKADIPLLAGHFLRKYCEQMGRDFALAGKNGCAACKFGEAVHCATSTFYQALSMYDWPGNVRELSNLILRLVATVPDEVLDVKHLPEQFRKRVAEGALSDPEDLTLDTLIRKHIDRVLETAGQNESQAARILGIPRSTLRSKMKKLKIESKGN